MAGCPCAMLDLTWQTYDVVRFSHMFTTDGAVAQTTTGLPCDRHRE